MYAVKIAKKIPALGKEVPLRRVERGCISMQFFDLHTALWRLVFIIQQELAFVVLELPGFQKKFLR